ncbi:MAG: alpha/beta hydrolase-fold protein [Salegentibacter sp.]
MKHCYFLLSLLFFTAPLFAQSTASQNVNIFSIPAPQLDTVRTIRLYLPASYSHSKKDYPVIYMHDAQNLFDKATSYVGEWKVDEYLDSLASKEVIVVGIDHGGEKRINELTPFPNEKYGGGKGAAYVGFIVNNLKPYIDQHYRTLKDPANTAIFGSSLGGLISFYAALKYPGTFGKAGVFSPSFWFSDKIYDFAKFSELNPDTKFYFLAGTNEEEGEIPDIERMLDLLRKKGLAKQNYKVKFIEGGEHNEALWSSAFPAAFEWLMAN